MPCRKKASAAEFKTIRFFGGFGMKKIVIVFAAILISGLTLFGAGCSVYSLYPGRKAFIGISMPNNTAQRWVRDGEIISNTLISAAKSHTVEAAVRYDRCLREMPCDNTGRF